MANWFQYLLLGRHRAYRQFNVLIFSAGLLLSSQCLWAQNSGSTKDIDSELFELGLNTGVINIQDFGSEFIVGLNGTFKASEDFFLQLNYLQASASLSSFEKVTDARLIGNRTFRHYDLLLGYNIFQGEVFSGESAGLSSLYLVAGVGDTNFGGESGFSYTFGLGYQMALSRRCLLRFDYRDYLHETSLLTDTDELTIDVHMSAGLSWLF